MERAIKTLESSITKNITALVSGKITQEEFLSKKEIVNSSIEKKSSELNHLREQLNALTEGNDAIDQRLSEFRPIKKKKKLNRDLIDLLIDKVVIHSANDIEIVWLERWCM
jgi:hypothetical protein